jgi:hypothetical protein
VEGDDSWQSGAVSDPGAASGSELNLGAVDGGILAGDGEILFDDSGQSGAVSTQVVARDAADHGEGGEQPLANTRPAGRPPATSNQSGCLNQVLAASCFAFFQIPSHISNAAKSAVEEGNAAKSAVEEGNAAKSAVEEGKEKSKKSTQGSAAKSQEHPQGSTPTGYTIRAQA